MLRQTMMEINVKSGIQSVLQRMSEVYEQRPKHIKSSKPQLIAVSKIKPAELVIEAYKAGQRHFGENYVQELLEKSQHPELLRQCPDIKWHLIGHLQSNKINKVIKVPNLFMIQTVDNEKLANAINSAWEKIDVPNKTPLRILVQVNSSGEDVKSGLSPAEAPALFKHIKCNLKNLQVCGIMTIGAYGYDYAKGPNPDFVGLIEVKKRICEDNNIEPEALEVSMGMSNDYDKAIEMGSTMVRVGSAIFGERPQKTTAC